MKIAQKILFLVILAVCSPELSFGQYTINRYGVSLGGENEDKALNIQYFKGIYWRPANNKYFKIDLSHLDTRISGSGECVNFYDAVAQDYVGIICGDYLQNSDSRAKVNIAGIDSVELSHLTPVSFKWKKNKSPETTVNSELFGKDVHYGFLAQEIEKIYPDLVRMDATGVKMVNYTGLLPLIIKNLQQLDDTINEQEATIESLFREIELLEQ